MALFKQSKNLRKSAAAAFERALMPCGATPHTGIYQCSNCGCEVVSTAGHPLPPANHAEHDPRLGKVSWKLVVVAEEWPARTGWTGADEANGTDEKSHADGPRLVPARKMEAVRPKAAGQKS